MFTCRNDDITDPEFSAGSFGFGRHGPTTESRYRRGAFPSPLRSFRRIFSKTFKYFVLNPLSQDMAGTILFLASRAGAYVNGAVWLVDGGRVGTVASNY